MSETIDSTDLRRAKKMRASRLPQVAPDPALNVGDDGDEQAAPSVGRKLTKGQRAILIRVIAQHFYIDAVREVLAEEYPEFPPISDNLIRYYRRMADAELNVEVLTARALALRSGLANKAVRVGYLIRMVEQWRRVPLVESSRYFDDEGIETTIYKTREGASRETRELLKQIAQELGQLAPAGMSPPADRPGDAGTESDEIDADQRATIEELIAEIAERDRETEAALVAAVRPERE